MPIKLPSQQTGTQIIIISFAMSVILVAPEEHNIYRKQNVMYNVLA